MKFFERNASISVPVELLEDLFQLDNFARICLDSNCHKSDLLNFFGFLELFHVVNIQLAKNILINCLFSKISDPSVLECLLSGEPFLWLGDEFLDKVFGIVRYVIPLFAIEVKLLLLNHLENFLIVVTVEWRISAKKNVEHASSRPHIACNVIITGKNFWRDVVWGSSSSLHSLKT